MGEIGGLAIDSLIQKLNIPYPPASVANTDPHRRTGQLSAGVRYRLEDSTGHVTAYIISTRESRPMVPIFLEDGTVYMAARNYMKRLGQEWADKLPSVFVETFWGKMAA